MSSLLKNIIRFILFLFIQVYVLSHVPPLHQIITPYLYFLFILWLPFSINRWGLLLLGFAFGMSVDYFLGTPGLHAAPCTLIAYLRPFFAKPFYCTRKYRTKFCRTLSTQYGLGTLCTICGVANLYTPFLFGINRVAELWNFWLFYWQGSCHNRRKFGAYFYYRNAIF